MMGYGAHGRLHPSCLLDTTPNGVEQAMRACREAGKTPIQLKDVVAVNRVLYAFLVEAVRLVEAGVATPEDIGSPASSAPAT
jgi:3-hydroxyacyl-CoA dehydrogenase